MSSLNLHLPNAARIYDYLLGGKDNFAADRDAADLLLGLAPGLGDVARVNREFLDRAIAYLIELGHGQFLDLGSGLPTRRNVHELARERAPQARTVYIDTDPIVLTHGRAMLRGDDVAMIEGDLRRPERILADPAVREVLDFDQPIVAILLAVLHFVPDEEHPTEIITALRTGLPPGSRVIVSHACHEGMSPEAITAGLDIYRQTGTSITPRTAAEITALVEGCALHEPGVIEVPQWHAPADGPPSGVQQAHFLGLVADLSPARAFGDQRASRPRAETETAA